MQSPFYASGFLYCLKTRQILLLKSNKQDTGYSILGGESKEGEEAQVTFQRIISQLLNVNLKPKNIFPIYDYFSDSKNQLNFVFYAEVGSTKRFNDVKKGSLSWFKFSETLKMPFNTQTKQDIVVGERVIGLKQRVASNLQALPWEG